jgi:hypothetical protein
MRERLDLILQIITTDFFIIFGLYSIIYVIISFFTKKEIIDTIDRFSCKVISHASIIYIIAWILFKIVAYNESTEYENWITRQRMFGEYWYTYWIQPFTWLIISQLLCIKKIRKLIGLRIIFSFFYIFTFESIIYKFISHLQHSFLPSTWNPYFSYREFIIWFLIKLLQFFIIVAIYYFIDKKIIPYLKKRSGNQ